MVPAIHALVSRAEVRLIDLKDVTADLEADFLVVPGGPGGMHEGGVIENEELRGLIQNIRARNGLLAGISNGALILRRPGSALLGERDVLVDGDLITAKASASGAFAQAVITRLGLQYSQLGMCLVS
ncbi:MAG: hypothetical protein ACXVBW_13735 [Bdellovibrionota bacterium]